MINKIIIPVAGYGTRFLPASKTTPKEMFPVLNKPILQYVVEEAVAAGIKDIILVTGPDKKTLEDHFDYTNNLEQHLRHFKKTELLKQMQDLVSMANFIYIRQKQFYGNGYPILAAESLINNEPFAVAWGDEFFVSKKPRLTQLIETFNKYQSPVMTGEITDNAGTKTRGIIEGEKINQSTFRINKLMEKPGPKKTKSRIATLGGYILVPEIINILKSLSKKLKKNEELYLTNAINLLAQEMSVYAKIIEGEFINCGNPIEWLKSNIKMGLLHHDFKSEIKKYLKTL